MQFLKYISQLLEQNRENMSYSNNGVCLIAPYATAPPLAKHMVFPPMQERSIQWLKESYRYAIPSDLLNIYKSANGMGLFWTRCYLDDLSFSLPCCQLAIYGVPRSFDRSQLEPYNISIEDLNRLPGTPQTWLKFGSFTNAVDNQILGEYDLSIDVESNKAYLSNREGEALSICKEWPSIDVCLCILFERLKSVD